MAIESVKYNNAENTSVVAIIDGFTYSIPCDDSNRYWDMILDWQFGPAEDVGGFMVRPTVEINSIEPYVAPKEE